MENAVKALLIASSVLIGIMILSLGVSLFSSLSSYVETTQESIVSKQTQQFNQQFLKYINCNSSGDIEFTLTIQDIVTAANIAYENNKDYGLDIYSGNNYYVSINIPGQDNIEKNINTQTVQILENGYELVGGNLQAIEYKCTADDVKINTITGRVYEVRFTRLH